MSGLPNNEILRPLRQQEHVDKPKLVLALLYVALVIAGLIGAVLL